MISFNDDQIESNVKYFNKAKLCLIKKYDRQFYIIICQIIIIKDVTKWHHKVEIWRGNIMLHKNINCNYLT